MKRSAPAIIWFCWHVLFVLAPWLPGRPRAGLLLVSFPSLDKYGGLHQAGHPAKANTSAIRNDICIPGVKSAADAVGQQCQWVGATIGFECSAHWYPCWLWWNGPIRSMLICSDGPSTCKGCSGIQVRMLTTTPECAANETGPLFLPRFCH